MRSLITALVRAGLLAGLAAVAGCADPPLPTGPPGGWQADEARWWTAGFDTTGIFRDLESFAEMGVELQPVVYGKGRETLEDQLVNVVQYRLIALYRNHPHVVDSLFRRYAEPRIRKGLRKGPVEEQVEPQVRAAYAAIARHFREPRALRTIGGDIPLPERPDSLRAYTGDVRMQVWVDPKGQTRAIELLEGVHPVLDAMAMRATTQMEWSPAYLHAEPIGAWARFRLGFAGAGD